MTRRPDPPAPVPKGDASRERRLAEALRANLRRRKAQPQLAPPKDKEERT